MPLTAGGVVFRRCRSRHEQAPSAHVSMVDGGVHFFQLFIALRSINRNELVNLPIDQSIFLIGRSFQKSETIHVHTGGLVQLLEAEMAGTKGAVGKNSV